MFALVNSLAAAGFAQNDVAKMLSELKKFGANGHLYIPGVGAISGITAGNYLDSIGTTNASVDGNVGLVKDALGGLNASQATTGYQPRLRRGIVNMLSFSNDLTNAAWSMTAGGMKQSANSITFSATNNQLGQTVNTNASVGVSATGAAILSGAGSIVLVLARSGSGAYEDSTLTINLTPTPTLYAVSKTIANTGQTGFRFALVKTAGSTATSITMDGAALLKGALTAEQIKATGGIPVTTTAPASSSAGAYNWEFDGVDDYMSLGGIPFQISDDHYTAIALTPNELNTAKHILNPANGAASQQVGNISVDGNSKYITRWCDDATNVLVVADTVTVAPGVASVLASRRAGTTGVLRKNGAQVGSISLASLGATTLTLPGVIGAYKTGASPSAISLHGVVVIKGTVSDAQALIFERGLNALSQYAAGRF